MKRWRSIPCEDGVPISRTIVVAGALVLVISCTSSRTANDAGLYPYRGPIAPGTLHLHCTHTAPYCGGAEIDPSEYPQPMRWSGSLFLRRVVPDSTGKLALNDPGQPIFDPIRTGSDGHGYLSLPVGHYLLLDSDRVDRRRHDRLLKDFAKPTMDQDAIDKECLRRWLRGPFGVISITSGDTLHLENAMQGQCPWYATPCVAYHGPLPP